MTIPEAVKQLLAMKKQPLETMVITRALQDGGIAFSTVTPNNTVGSVLNRQAAKGDEIISVGRGKWALAAWYPNPSRFKKKADKIDNHEIEDGSDLV